MVKIIRLSTSLARTCTTQHSTNSCYTNHYNFHTWAQQIAKLLYFTLYEYWPQRPSSSQLATLHELSFCPFSSAFLPSSSIILAVAEHLASSGGGRGSPVMLISKSGHFKRTSPTCIPKKIGEWPVNKCLENNVWELRMREDGTKSKTNSWLLLGEHLFSSWQVECNEVSRGDLL